MPELNDDVLAALYCVPPDEFMAQRAELVERSRSAGDAKAAQAIGTLRKPTVAAWIVNALVLDDPSVADRLSELGSRLRTAQDALDATRLRELSTERRELVAALCTQAFRRAGRSDPPAALRDEVSGTFDAAIADPAVAQRLGRLQRAEQWSGFGFGPAGAPQLTVVRGGRDDKPATKTAARAKRSAADTRKQQRALARSRAAFEAAESAYDEARGAEQALAQEIRRLTGKLAKVQGRLDDARAELDDARDQVTAARAARRQARSDLDRAEREVGDDE